MVLLSHRTLTETLELQKKQVQCPICLETYCDPKVLTCLHAYCRECIQQLLLQEQRDQEVECPQCHSVVTVAGNDPSSLPTVFFINRLIEECRILKKAESNEITCQSCSSVVKATSFCHTCSMFICASCSDAHEKMKVFKGHKAVPVSEMSEETSIQLSTPTPPCQKHEGELNLYCLKCEQLICRDCTLVEHAGHNFNFVKGVAVAYKEEILSTLVPLRDTHANVTTTIASLEETKKEIRDQGTDIATTITKSFKELHAILDNREQVLLQKAQEVVGRKVGVLDRQQEDLHLWLATLDSLVWFVEKMVENASDEEFISLRQQMISRVQQVSRKYLDVKLSPKETANTFVAVPSPTSLAELFSVAEVDGSGLKFATTKRVAKFTVHTHDIYGQPTPVQQNVSAKLKSLVDGSVLQATVVSQTPSTYELSYTPTTRGHHQLTVRINNTEIGKFQVFVQHPPTQLGTPVSIIEGVKPYYIAVGDKGELFVTECLEHRYTVLDAQGQRVLTIGCKRKLPFGDGLPTGITTDGEGNVYVASTDHKVQKFNRRGEVVKSIGENGGNVGEFDGPFGVKYHNDQVYVCDCNNARVQVFDSDLNFVRSFGTRGDGPGQFKQPWDIDFDAQGNIYVVDLYKGQVIVFSEDGQYLRHFGQKGPGEGQLSEPRGMCVSGDYVYVTETGGNWFVNALRYNWNSVSVFRTSGEFIHSFWNWDSELPNPRGITVDQDGFVLVGGKGSTCIRVF